MNAPQCPENCRGDMPRAHRISLRHRNVDSRDSLIVVLRVAGVPRSERVNVEAHARQVTLVQQVRYPLRIHPRSAKTLEGVAGSSSDRNVRALERDERWI